MVESSAGFCRNASKPLAGDSLLVGIGLNVGTNLAAAPDHVRAMATSLATLHAKPLDLSVSERLLPAILTRIAVGLARA